MGIFERMLPLQGDGDYARDYAAWAFSQARRLRSLRPNDLDALNIAEELEDLGKGEVRELISLLRVVILHLLKWDIQPTFRSQSWSNSIREHQRRATDHLSDNPSLKPVMGEIISEAFRRARFKAINETGLADKAFPTENPYDQATILSRICRLDDPE